GDTGVRLERRIAAEEDRVAHSQTRRVTSRANAKHSPLIQLVGNAETRLDFTPLNVGVMVGNAAKQAAEVELARVGFRKVLYCGRRESAAGNDHAVKRIRPGTGNKPCLRINRALD